MYLWGATLVGWVDWAQSEVVFSKVVGIAGMALASLSGIAAFLYVNGLESQVKRLQEKMSLMRLRRKNEWTRCSRESL